MPTKVTDPALLAVLDAPGGKVTDPSLLAQLDATGPAAAPGDTAAAPRPSVSRWSQKLGEGMAPGFNRLVAGAQAAADPLLGRTDEWGEDFGTRYGAHLAAEQGQSRETQAEHPIASTALQVAGGVPSALATGGGSASNVAAQTTRLGRAAQGMKTGAGFGAMYAAGDAPAGADPLTLASHAVGGATMGTVLGGGMGALMPSHVPDPVVLKAAAANNAEAAASAPTTVTASPQAPRLLRRVAAPKPTKEAELLLSEGVPLTAGLQDPRSAVGQIETASQSLRAAGPLITAQRDAARKATQGTILNKILPPGMEPRKWTGEIDEAMDAIYQGFNKAYESVKGGEIYPAIHRNGKGIPLQGRGKSPGAFDEILADKGVMASADTRSQVRAFLENELSLLPHTVRVEKHGMHAKTIRERPSMVAPVPVERMLAMRSNIRTQIRRTTRGNASREDFAAAEFLKRAERAVTDAIESQVDEATASALKAVDAQYRNYKIVEDAVAKAGDGTLGFNGRQITGALRSSMSQGEMARGGGGELRQLAKAYTRTFDESMSPPTGARLLTVGPLGEWLTGPLVFQMNRPSAPPSMLPSRLALPPASSDAAAMAAALQRHLGVRAVPAMADEDQTK